MTPTPNPERAGFRADIEGLRGVAILLVVAFHAGVSRLAGGFVGVDVFFVLSGYLITGLLVREVRETGDVDLSEFYARRARRLLPALLVVLLATIALALWFYAPIDQPPIASDARAVALHYGNVIFARNAVNYHAASSNPFLHTWSLAVEEQFYIVWPLLFALIGRFYGNTGATRGRLIACVAGAGAISFVASAWVTGVAQPWAFFGMPTRIWEFALGGVAALMIVDAPRTESTKCLLLQLAGFGAIVVAALLYHEALPYPGTAALLPALGAVAVIAGGHLAPASAVSRALGARSLQWFGRMSYSWYLWHWPLVGLGAVLDWKIGVGGKIAWSIVALGFAVITNRFIEEPMRRAGGARATADRTNAVAVGASFAVALVAWGTLLLANRRASSPAQRPFASARVDHMDHDCWGSLTENATAPCVFGDLSSTTKVVLMGDSHAEHWLPAMERIGRERHWKVYAMVKPACPVADIPEMVNARLKRHYVECTAWRRAKLRQILALRPSLVVLSSYDHYIPADGDASAWNVTPALWQAGLRRTYGLLSSAGITTIAMRDVPDAGFDAPACLSGQASRTAFRTRGCDYDLAESLRKSAIDAQSAAARGLRNVAIVSMNDRVCSRSPCSVLQRGVIVFRDGDHLTAAFSRAEARILGERIVAAATRIGN
jgi:peptidoglycan/LPS O-acetylase OafA/YrhL